MHSKVGKLVTFNRGDGEEYGILAVDNDGNEPDEIVPLNAPVNGGTFKAQPAQGDVGGGEYRVVG